MRALFLVSLITGLGFVGSGCVNPSSSNEHRGRVEIDYENMATLASESEFVFYQEQSSPIVADLWLPENDEGVTLVEFHGDPDTRQISKVILYSGNEVLGDLTSGPNYSLIGTIARNADGSVAYLEEVSGDEWKWLLIDPDGESVTVTVSPPLPPTSSNRTPSSFVPTRYASLTQSRFDHRAVIYAVSSAVASIEIKDPDEALSRTISGLVLAGDCETDKPGAFCDVDISPVNGQLYISSWVRTNLSDILSDSPNLLVFETSEDCRNARSRHNWEGIGIGAVISIAGLVFTPLGPWAVVGGILVAVGVNLGAPICGGLVTNEALRADAFTRFDDARISARWGFSIPNQSHWSVITEPNDATIQPFLYHNKSGMRLAPVVVTISLSEWVPREVYDGDLPKEDFVPGNATEWDLWITVSIGSDGKATVRFRVFYRSSDSCHHAEGSSPAVVVRDDGSFETTVPYDATRFIGETSGYSGDPCAQLGPLEHWYELSISGRLDAASGRGTLVVDIPADIVSNGHYEIALTRTP